MAVADDQRDPRRLFGGDRAVLGTDRLRRIQRAQAQGRMRADRQRNRADQRRGNRERPAREFWLRYFHYDHPAEIIWSLPTTRWLVAPKLPRFEGLMVRLSPNCDQFAAPQQTIP